MNIYIMFIYILCIYVVYEYIIYYLYYVYITIIIIINWCCLYLAGILGCILCPYGTDVSKSLQVD